MNKQTLEYATRRILAITRREVSPRAEKLVEEAHGLVVELAAAQSAKKQVDPKLLCALDSATARYQRRLIKFAFGRVKRN